MNLEQTFIKKLENYFTEKYSDFDKKRIETFLLDYKKELDLKEKTIIEEVVREVKVYEKVESYPEGFSLKEYRKVATPSIIEEEARKICEKHKIDYNIFIKRGRKTTMEIALIRKEFCIYMACNYEVRLVSLGDFFNLHHATICYYIYGSRYTPKSDRKVKIKVQRRVPYKLNS